MLCNKVNCVCVFCFNQETNLFSILKISLSKYLSTLPKELKTNFDRIPKIFLREFCSL